MEVLSKKNSVDKNDPLYDILPHGKVRQLDQRKKALVYRLVGIRIMYYRTLRGWSQEELARRTGVSKSTISKIEQGKYGAGLSLAMILDIGEALEVGMDVLVVASNQDL